jgi:hypothetical protein
MRVITRNDIEAFKKTVNIVALTAMTLNGIKFLFTGYLIINGVYYDENKHTKLGIIF